MLGLLKIRCKEAPKACRNFIQLCQEGYYDNTVFHRIIAGILPPRAPAATVRALSGTRTRFTFGDASVEPLCSAPLQSHESGLAGGGLHGSCTKHRR